jgi:tellurite resistance protein TerC
LIVIELSDIIFAFDSLPAILSITQDIFIVFASNIFAILGLRSLYFVLEAVGNKWKYVNYAVI